jgi:hypothetical protein
MSRRKTLFNAAPRTTRAMQLQVETYLQIRTMAATISIRWDPPARSKSAGWLEAACCHASTQKWSARQSPKGVEWQPLTQPLEQSCYSEYVDSDLQSRYCCERGFEPTYAVASSWCHSLYLR